MYKPRNPYVNQFCPECKSPKENFIYEEQDGDLVCGDCGLVIGEQIPPVGDDKRTFDDEEEDNKQNEEYDTLNDSTDNTVTRIQPSGNAFSQKLAKTQFYASSVDTTLHQLRAVMVRLCERVPVLNGSVANALEFAKQYLEKAKDLGYDRTVTLVGPIALYVAARTYGKVAIELDEILLDEERPAKKLKGNTTESSAGLKSRYTKMEGKFLEVMKKLNVKLPEYHKDFVSRYCHELGILKYTNPIKKAYQVISTSGSGALNNRDLSLVSILVVCKHYNCLSEEIITGKIAFPPNLVIPSPEITPAIERRLQNELQKIIIQ
jgi:transcription initiation factor TFIIIB Brf1 subunit/transcription initiation factor TFIIB